GVACAAPNDCWAVGQYNNGSAYQNLIEHYSVPAVQLNAVASRKVHGDAGTFDVDLPLTGSPGVECRSGGASGDYTLVFSFANTLNTSNPVSSITATATTSSGTQTLTSTGNTGTDTHQYFVNLT